MKQFIAFITIILFAFSCNKEPQRLLLDSVKIDETKTSISSELKIDYSKLDTIYFVDNNDINRYIHFKKLLNSKTCVNSITSYEVQGVTVFYIINYESGWEMVSADKRTQPILGRSEKGSFSMENYGETPWGTWAYTLGLDVLTERIYGSETTFEENQNLVFWGAMSSPICFSLPADTTLTRLPAVHTPVEPIEGINGYYELAYVTPLNEYDIINVDHLTTTLWNQGHTATMNQYVPFESNGSGLRAPSGCVAVAGAQMAYFLHNKIGKPALAPSEGFCSSYVGNPSDQTFSAPNSQIWGEMGINNNYASDLLIGYIGQTIGMEYGNGGSSASTIDGLPTYFTENNISCQNDNYGPYVIRNDLYNRGIPIIVRADAPEGSHSFIVDAYKYLGQRLLYTYTWHWYPWMLGQLLPHVLEKEEIEHEYTSVQFIRMNWGWDAYCNDIYFAPSGVWSDWLIGYSFASEGRQMLYDFR